MSNRRNWLLAIEKARSENLHAKLITRDSVGCPSLKMAVLSQIAIAKFMCGAYISEFLECTMWKLVVWILFTVNLSMKN